MINSPMLTLAAGAMLCTVLRAAEPLPTRPFYNQISDEDEIALGRGIAARIEKEGFRRQDAKGRTAVSRELRNPILEGYLQDLVTRLGAASQRRELNYRIRVLDDPKTVNALALPGGFLYIYTGMLDYVDNESELAAVLGHEVGHVVGRHSINRIARLGTIAGLLDRIRKAGGLDESVTDGVMSVISDIDSRTFYSRDEEIEADLLGFYEAMRCRWDPSGGVSLHAKMGGRSGRPWLLESFLSTHPDSGTRVARLRKELNEAEVPRNLTQDSLAFKTMKLGLGLLH